MTYTNTPIVVSQQTTGYTSGNIPYSSIVLIAGIPHAAQLEVERIFTQDRDGSTGPLLAFLADPAVTTAQKKAVFTIPISRCTLDSITSNITAIDLPATGGTVYDYVITTPTPTTYTIKIPSLSQHGSSTVTVRRKTVSNEPFVNWQAGSRLTSKQLNLATTQSLYLIQEALEKIGTSVTIETTQITVSSIAANSINSAALIDLAVTTAKIADLAVTTGKIADLAVTTGKIAAGAVTEAKLADNSVTSAKIVNNTIVNEDINSAAAIVDTKLATISTAGKVSNSATTAVTAATADTIVLRGTSGAVTTGPLTATTITGVGAVGITGTVTATGFVGPLTGNVTGNADTATSTTTVASLPIGSTNAGIGMTVMGSEKWIPTGTNGLANRNFFRRSHANQYLELGVTNTAGTWETVISLKVVGGGTWRINTFTVAYMTTDPTSGYVLTHYRLNADDGAQDLPAVFAATSSGVSIAFVYLPSLKELSTTTASLNPDSFTASSFTTIVDALNFDVNNYRLTSYLTLSYSMTRIA